MATLLRYIRCSSQVKCDLAEQGSEVDGKSLKQKQVKQRKLSWARFRTRANQESGKSVRPVTPGGPEDGPRGEEAAEAPGQNTGGDEAELPEGHPDLELPTSTTSSTASTAASSTADEAQEQAERKKDANVACFLERREMFTRLDKTGGAEHGWLPFDAANFPVRSRSYLKDKRKEPSAPALLETVNLDFFLIGKSGPIHRVASHHDCCPAHCRKNGDNRFLFIQNWILPPYQAVITSALSPSADWLVNDTPQSRTWKRFLNASNDERREAFKLIVCVEKGPWLVKAVVPKKPVIIGRPLKMESWHVPGDHLEISIDVSSGRVEQMATSITMMALRNIEIAMSVLIESKSEDELPEVLLACDKVMNMDTSRVMAADT